jgi:DNA replication protein DnaC
MNIATIQSKMEQLKMSHTANLINELSEDVLRGQVKGVGNGMNALDFLEHVLTMEVQWREESRVANSLKISGLPKGMHLDNFDFLFQPSVDKLRIDHLSNCDYIRNHENVLLFGPPGVGKTHLAVGLGVRAIYLGYSVIYYTVEELLQQLKKRSETPVAKQRGRAYVKNALVVLDELGYQTMDRNETHLFFQFVSARYMRGSTIITSNRSVKEWVSIFDSDEMATTAILDRLFHKANIFNIDGKSYRLRNFDRMVKEAEKKQK